MSPRSLAGWLVALLAVPAGIGVLYLERKLAVLNIGPAVPGALPLQQLAGGEAQPLVRLLVAWVPAGGLAGPALARATRSRAAIALPALGALALGLLLLAGAAADAVAVSESLSPHLLPQLRRPATWIAVGLLLLGAGASWRQARRDRVSGPSAAPSAT